MNGTLHSAAIDLTSIVFPVPGGPHKSIPLEGVSMVTYFEKNMSGYCKGKRTCEVSFSLICLSPPIRDIRSVYGDRFWSYDTRLYDVIVSIGTCIRIK